MASILRDQINLKRSTSHTYTAAYHADWSVGPNGADLERIVALHGGSVAAVIYHAAATHLSTTLADRNQPDVLTCHYEFLRTCKANDSTITVIDLGLGSVTSTLQIHLSQNGQTKVVALVLSINFDIPVGPTVPTAWNLHPPPKPAPDFENVLAHKPDEHWLPLHIAGEILPLTGHMLLLNPRGGFPVGGIYDSWITLIGGESMDATYLPVIVDINQSMSDTLLRNRGVYDARWNFAQAERWAAGNPGVPAELTNSLEQAVEATLWDNTVTLDIEFKRRVPEGGVRWVFTRAVTRMLEGGRMDLDLTVCDEKMKLLCLAHHVVLALDATRKFGSSKAKPAL